jgi:hypothetical protein
MASYQQKESPMKTYVKLVLTATLTVFATAAVAENPFAGTWKFDASKSKVTGHTVTFTTESAGTIQVTAEGQSYSFKPDGSAAKTPFGDTVVWTKIDDSTWKAVYTKDSTVLDTDIWKLAVDGKSAEVSSTGLFAKWKSTKVSNNAPDTTVIEANGDDGIIWNIPEMKASLALKFDGKDVAPTGPTVPDGFTLSAKRISPREFAIEEKINGKAVWKGTNTVSADGKTLTQVGSPAGVSEPTTAVYQKQ